MLFLFAEDLFSQQDHQHCNTKQGAEADGDKELNGSLGGVISRMPFLDAPGGASLRAERLTKSRRGELRSPILPYHPICLSRQHCADGNVCGRSQNAPTGRKGKPLQKIPPTDSGWGKSLFRSDAVYIVDRCSSVGDTVFFVFQNDPAGFTVDIFAVEPGHRLKENIAVVHLSFRGTDKVFCRE